MYCECNDERKHIASDMLFCFIHFKFPLQLPSLVFISRLTSVTFGFLFTSGKRLDSIDHVLWHCIY